MSTRKKREEVTLPLEVSKDLYEKFRKDIGRKAFKFLTPYMLAQQYNIKISTARKLLRLAHKQGLLKPYSGGRRSPIYIIE